MPPCFIGSSSEGEPYATALDHHLRKLGMPSQLWSIDTFETGRTAIESLEDALRRCSFAALVATPDDLVKKRGKKKLAPRDNVILEFGMFMGRLGRERAFLLTPDSFKDLHLPSDLLGVSLGTYKHQAGASTRQQRTAMKPRADEIVKIADRLKGSEPFLDGSIVDDMLDGLAYHLGHFHMQPSHAWTQAVLRTVLERFVARAEDAYAAWLRPDASEKLMVVQHVNLPANYNDDGWGANEGLAGKVWTTGVSAGVSTLSTHPWFEPRPGCENESYVCAAVGHAGGSGGILAIASDAGFPEERGDAKFVATYAALLGMAVHGSSPTVGSLVDTALGSVAAKLGFARR